jgi:hypothetical protein
MDSSSRGRQKSSAQLKRQKDKEKRATKKKMVTEVLHAARGALHVSLEEVRKKIDEGVKEVKEKSASISEDAKKLNEKFRRIYVAAKDEWNEVESGEGRITEIESDPEAPLSQESTTTESSSYRSDEIAGEEGALSVCKEYETEIYKLKDRFIGSSVERLSCADIISTLAYKGKVTEHDRKKLVELNRLRNAIVHDLALEHVDELRRGVSWMRQRWI